MSITRLLCRAPLRRFAWPDLSGKADGGVTARDSLPNRRANVYPLMRIVHLFGAGMPISFKTPEWQGNRI